MKKADDFNSKLILKNYFNFIKIYCEQTKYKRENYNKAIEVDK